MILSLIFWFLSTCDDNLFFPSYPKTEKYGSTLRRTHNLPDLPWLPTNNNVRLPLLHWTVKTDGINLSKDWAAACLWNHATSVLDQVFDIATSQSFWQNPWPQVFITQCARSRILLYTLTIFLEDFPNIFNGLNLPRYDVWAMSRPGFVNLTITEPAIGSENGPKRP